MDKIFETLKEKLESPVLLNYFIGLLLFNRKVVYTALSMDYHDRVGHFYLYKENMYNSKIEMLSVVYAEEQLCGYSTLYFWPIVYAIVVAIGLPYVKAVFNAVHENADKFYEWFRVWLNQMETVSQELHDSVNKELRKALIEVKNIEKENNELRSENLGYKENIKNAHTEVGTSRAANATLNAEKETLKNEILQIKSTLFDNEPSIGIVLKGIWKFEYVFVQPSKFTGGIEYIKIVNHCEIHTSDSPNGQYKLRCFVDRYQFIRNGIDVNGTPSHRVKFKKTFTTENEDANCDYFIVNEDEIGGYETYTDDRGRTNNQVNITIKKIKGEAGSDY